MQEQIKSSDKLFSITFDTTEATRQAEELSEALARVFPDGAPHQIVENIPRLLSDFILRDSSTTVGADGIRKRLIALRFGRGFDHIMTALRAGKIFDLVHAANDNTIEKAG